jgi:hypothetical protein
MRAIACSGSIFAYSTPATHDIQITTPISKSMPMNPAKKKIHLDMAAPTTNH